MKRIFLFVMFLVLSRGITLADTMLPATGTLDLRYFSYSGTLSPITVDMGSGPVSTGLISYTLDKSFGADNFWDFNFDTGATDSRMHLLITSPLLTKLGMPAIPLEINESGPLDFIPLVDTSGGAFVLDLSATTVGSGTLQAGPIANSDLTLNITWINKCFNDNTVNNNHGTNVDPKNVSGGSSGGSISGTVTSPGGTQQSINGTGAGGTGVPEPSTLSLSLMSLAFVCWKMFGYSRR